ncbi:MAG: shikimate dehydrogenase [Sphingobium sp.]
MTHPITAQPRYLTGLIGRGIQASRSPWLHEQEADAQGLRLIYRLFDFAADGHDESHLPLLLDALQIAGFAGVNVTHPYKQAVMNCLDDLSDQARAIGAVNTIAFREGRRIGHNTDVTGFAESFRNGLPDAAIDRVVQMGAGGAGAATAHALMGLGIRELTIFDADPERASRLCATLCDHYGAGRAIAGTGLEPALAGADGVVNATPMGMAAHPGSSVPAELLRPALWVSDIVYVPLETQLIKDARAAGCATLDGGGMAVFQAVGAFQLFTGFTPDAERMRRSFSEGFGKI